MVPEHVVSLVYTNAFTGECTNDSKCALRWHLEGCDVLLTGYTQYEWVDSDIKEVWH